MLYLWLKTIVYDFEAEFLWEFLCPTATTEKKMKKKKKIRRFCRAPSELM
jgi:hypothetical protein